MNDDQADHDWKKAENHFRRRCFPGATARDWADWCWQLRHAVRTPDALAALLLPALSQREARALQLSATWRMPLLITPYSLMLLSAEEPDGPLRRTLLPDVREGRTAPGEHRDPLGEEAHQVAPNLIRSYPHKALLLAASTCACACRYCTRSRTAGCRQPSLRKAIAYLRRTPDIHDVLLSGGDPLTLDTRTLDALLSELRDIPHIKLLRIGSKIPAVLPQRITPDLLACLKRHKPLWMSTHFVHPHELTPAAANACRRLASAGIPLMNQTVLLKNINDTTTVMRELNETLLLMDVKPYYLHQGDMAAGTAHLRSTIATGRRILKELCGNTTGYAIPHFMLDQPGGGGKISL